MAKTKEKKEKQDETISIPISEYEELVCYRNLWLLAEQMERGQMQMLQTKQRLAQLQANKQ